MVKINPSELMTMPLPMRSNPKIPAVNAFSGTTARNLTIDRLRASFSRDMATDGSLILRGCHLRLRTVTNTQPTERLRRQCRGTRILGPLRSVGIGDIAQFCPGAAGALGGAQGLVGRHHQVFGGEAGIVVFFLALVVMKSDADADAQVSDRQ